MINPLRSLYKLLLNKKQDEETIKMDMMTNEKKNKLRECYTTKFGIVGIFS